MDEINEIAMYSEDVCTRAVDLVRFSRDIIVKEVNSVQLITYYILGMWIVEEQQNGDKRAEYGKSVLKRLSDSLQKEFGKGFSVDTLEHCRKFYLTYKDRISEPVARKFGIMKSEPLARKLIESQPFYLP